jgi:hypothetical protein|nr:MAG: hypothetical protein KatS3mg041_0924 [Bacteroidota bacterium]
MTPLLLWTCWGLFALDSLDAHALFRSARWTEWRALLERDLPYAYLVQTRTEQLASDGSVLAWQERLVRRFYEAGKPRYEVLSEHTEGVFDWGVPGGSGGAPSSRGEDRGGGPISLGWRPPSAQEGIIRLRDEAEYLFRFLGTERVGEIQAQVVEATLRPNRAKRQELKRVRLYLEPDTRRIVKLEMRLERRSLLLDVDLDLQAELGRGPGGVWLPAQTVSHIRYKIPFRHARFLRITARYRDYVPVAAEQLPVK